MSLAKWIVGLALATCAAVAQPRLVTLNFAAIDAGRPVTDLTAAELQITDQGKTAPVVAFRNDALLGGVLVIRVRQFGGDGNNAARHLEFELVAAFKTCPAQIV